MKDWKPWTDREIEYLKLNYANKQTAVVANELGFDTKRVISKVCKLGLKKSEEYRLANGLTERGFKKGHKPHNAGAGMSEEVRAKVSHTWFKKGVAPMNKLEIGSIQKRNASKSRPSYYFILSEKREWLLYHRYLWEQHNGKIPKGGIVTFKDGNSNNCTIENLMLITMRENMRRNTIHNYPNELKSLIFLKSKLSRKIKNIKNYGKK